MSRTLKRVPLDFDWPEGEVWKGYLNPHYKGSECTDCKNGYTNAALRLQDLVHLLMLSGEDAMRQENHPWSIEKSSLFNTVIPSKEMLDLTSGLAERGPSFIGHDAIDNWTAYRKIVEAAGFDPKVWGICKTCKGEGMIKSKEYKEWESYEPPEGEGFQLWETCSKGSPCSPVFETLDELCEYAEKNCTTFGSNKTTKEKWKEMLNEDFVRHEEGNMVFF
jgi:hypothetical protein